MFCINYIFYFVCRDRFATIAPDIEWRQKINAFGNFFERLYSGYTREERDSLRFDYFQQCDDSRLASKIIFELLGIEYYLAEKG